MQSSQVLLCLCVVASALADIYPYQPVAEADREEYVLVPLSRVRRQTDFRLDKSGRASLSHTGTLLNNDRHRLDGTAFASKQFQPNGPLTAGGSLDYMHKPSGSTLGVSAANTRRFGTDVSANGRYNFYNKGATSVFAEGSYGRHFGGPAGNSRPNYYGGLGIQHRFK